MLTRRQKLVFAASAASGVMIPLSLWVRYRGRPRMVNDLSQLAPAPTALVLGCWSHPDGTPSTHLAERLEAALRCYRRGVVGQVLASGNAHATNNEVAAMYQWLVSKGIPPEHVQTDPDGIRTYASMRNAVSIHGLRDVIVCTHRYHLPRSLYLAEVFGLRAQGLGADQTPLKRPLRTHGREFAARAMAAVDGWGAQRTAEERRP